MPAVHSPLNVALLTRNASGSHQEMIPTSQGKKLSMKEITNVDPGEEWQMW
jgi:hypothetical protein